MPVHTAAGTTTLSAWRDPGLAAGEDVGDEQQHAQLGELRRLELHGPEVDPPGRAVDVDAHAGHEHGGEERHGGEVAPHREAPPDAGSRP